MIMLRSQRQARVAVPDLAPAETESFQAATLLSPEARTLSKHLEFFQFLFIAGRAGLAHGTHDRNHGRHQRPNQSAREQDLCSFQRIALLFERSISPRKLREAASPRRTAASSSAKSCATGWRRVSGNFADLDDEDGAAISERLAARNSTDLTLWHNSDFAVVRSLQSLDPREPAALLLLYPHGEAMKAYRPIQRSIQVFALPGLALVMLAS